MQLILVDKGKDKTIDVSALGVFVMLTNRN